MLIITFFKILFMLLFIFCSPVNQWPLTSWPILTSSFCGTEKQVSLADLELSHSLLPSVLNDTSSSSTLWSLTGLCSFDHSVCFNQLLNGSVFKKFYFCRIHYPLPLPYLGKPDPAELQREIRALRAELKTLGLRRDHKVSDQETRKLRAESVFPNEICT